MLGNLSVINPVIDVAKTVGQVIVILLNQVVDHLSIYIALLADRHELVFVHELVAHASLPSDNLTYSSIHHSTFHGDSATRFIGDTKGGSLMPLW